MLMRIVNDIHETFFDVNNMKEIKDNIYASYSFLCFCIQYLTNISILAMNGQRCNFG